MSALRPLVDQRLRRSAAYWKTSTQSGEQVRRSERQIFLIGIEPSAVFRGEHSPDRGRFDRAEKKASQRQWQQLVQVRQESAGTFSGGMPWGTAPISFTPRVSKKTSMQQLFLRLQRKAPPVCV